MLRLYDWMCPKCSRRAYSPELVEVPHGENPPNKSRQYCVEHGYVDHDRAVSMPGRYTGDNVRNPKMFGGEFDTMGYRRLPDLPDLPGQREHDAKVERALAALPDSAPKSARRDVINAHMREAPSSADYVSLFQKPEYREAERERSRIAKTNLEKRKRSAALASGQNVNFRTDRCAGDPKI